MKNRGKIIISIIGIFVTVICGTITAFSQGEIISVNPPSSFRGNTVHLIIQGSETDFDQETTVVGFPEYEGFIIKESTLVNNPELITVRITIAKDAPAGQCDIEITTKTQKHKTDFEIIAFGEEQPEAMITVFPVQSVYLSDFDFSNLRNLPLLFTISVYKPVDEWLRVYVELSHEKFGFVASAEKELANVGRIFTFDNRQFDSYDTEKAADEIIESAGGNGTIPPGLYTYIVLLYDKEGNQVGDLLNPVTSEFYISESVSGIDMIAPGTTLDSEPEVIFSNTPYFQWFGGLPEYSFTLYEVMEGQRSADDITSNLPVFQINKWTTASYLYPNFAEKLEEGKKYAWQITSTILTSSSSDQIKSDVYWFIYQRSDKSGRTLDNIKVYPDDLNLMPGDSVQIKVDGYDINGDSLKVDCEWKVIPEDLGMINDEGWFVAGNKVGTVAVSASCGSKKDYITINILKGKR